MTLPELIERAEQRDRSFEEEALLCENQGDTTGCWLAMASRAENRRFLEKLRLAAEFLGAP